MDANELGPTSIPVPKISTESLKRATSDSPKQSEPSSEKATNSNEFVALSEPSSKEAVNPNEFVAYIHNVSPIKNGKYFECVLQQKENVVRGVCFSPHKQKRFAALSSACTPVKAHPTLKTY